MEVYRVPFEILVEAESQEVANEMIQIFLRTMYAELGWAPPETQLTPDQLGKLN
jgi:hypothetical protein